MTVESRRAWMWVVPLVGVLLSACGTGSTRAPVEDRRSPVGGPVLDPNTAAVRQPPGFENAGKPGYYTVKPGETLIRIGLETGQNWKDIARWNNLAQPNQIEVGQVLRVMPPGITASSGEADSNGVVTRAVSTASVAATPVPSGSASGTAAKPSASVAPGAMSNGAASAAAESGLSWIWPATGPLLAGFDEVKNKGLDLGGKAGEPVLAAADGRVVYVGAGLRGYGNLIILKHNNTYLTAYAHNRALLVKEDQSVRKGQKIAEMGNSDADRVKLHFEVRRQGKPVDPIKYLPPR